MILFLEKVSKKSRRSKSWPNLFTRLAKFSDVGLPPCENLLLATINKLAQDFSMAQLQIRITNNSTINL